ncbi:MAG: hypothetical protein CMP91_03000 [Gammaproteobacteria bacterium]|nr:hypothetical protein [Gammaproteobacteria bacterium]
MFRFAFLLSINNPIHLNLNRFLMLAWGLLLHRRSFQELFNKTLFRSSLDIDDDTAAKTTSRRI